MHLKSIFLLHDGMKTDSVYKTLSEQMHIHDVEIRQRKRLLEFSMDEEARLAALWSSIKDDVPFVVQSFYEKLIENDEVAILIGDSGTLMHLNGTMAQYVKELFAGVYNLDYANNRLRIGLIHKRMGVTPKFYLAALLALKRALFALLEKNIQDPDELIYAKVALDKLLTFDSQLVFDAYFRSMILEVEVARDRAEKHERELEALVADRTRELEELARKDPLTGLWNRRHFIEELFCEMVRAQRENTSLSLLYIDLDGFKKLNDTQGHLAGDRLLCSFSRQLKRMCRKYDTVARMGGDEFVVLLPGLNADGAIQVAQRIINWDKREQYGIAMSVGIATAGHDNWPEGPERMLAIADTAMYQAKKNGGSQCIALELEN